MILSFSPENLALTFLSLSLSQSCDPEHWFTPPVEHSILIFLNSSFDSIVIWTLEGESSEVEDAGEQTGGGQETAPAESRRCRESCDEGRARSTCARGRGSEDEAGVERQGDRSTGAGEPHRVPVAPDPRTGVQVAVASDDHRPTGGLSEEDSGGGDCTQGQGLLDEIHWNKIQTEVRILFSHWIMGWLKISRIIYNLEMKGDPDWKEIQNVRRSWTGWESEKDGNQKQDGNPSRMEISKRRETSNRREFSNGMEISNKIDRSKIGWRSQMGQ